MKRWKENMRVVLSLHDAQFLRSTLRMVPARRLTSLDKRAIEQFDANIERAEIRSGRRRARTALTPKDNGK